MKYLQSIVVGLATAIASAIVYILTTSIHSFPQSGSEFISAGYFEFKAGPVLLLVVFAAFTGGFFWTLRKRNSQRNLNSN